jgi:GTP pyrophosphokinase
MTDDLKEKYGKFQAVILENNPTANLERIRAAFDYAHNAHSKQLRKDGNPYIVHPLAAAEIVAEMGLDEEAIMAALLHDVVEDTNTTLEEISKRFGASVAAIVDGVTKLSRVQFTSKEEQQVENLRKMLMAMAKDIRVIIIKMADRLHNMRTMEYQSPEKQAEKALETMEIYAPLAHRLGMQRIKWELEDRSIYYLDPIGYAEIQEGLARILSSNEDFINRMQEKIAARLREIGVECTVYGRIKHVYSIYRKMYSQNKTLAEVLDLYAFRVIVSDIADCYNVLGYIHEMFRPLPGHFKDYIGTPKPNMYQSLHTTVLGTEGIPFEVQIRTWEMHHTAEYGVAAHWKYKQGVSKKTADEEKFAWVRRLLETQQDADAQDFVESLKIDMFSDEVFVFTPKGDVVNLPAGATPIDFAYNIHSAVGNRMTGAIVNGRIVPYNHILSNGDIVEVLTSNSSKGPSRDWLTIVKSPVARNKIRQWFKKEKREENIAHGKLSFEAELRRALLPMSEVTREDVLPKILARLKFPSLEELYAAIGYGGMSAQKAVNRIRDELRTIERAKRAEDSEEISFVSSDKKLRPIHGILVEGIDNCLVKFARCCSPVPGDPAIGYITRGFGVSVHRKDCKNYLKSIANPEEAGRWVRVAWANSETDVYSTSLFITAKERSGVVLDITMILSAMKLKMTSLSARDDNGVTNVALVIEVHNSTELSNAIARLATIQGVIDIRRGDG